MQTIGFNFNKDYSCNLHLSNSAFLLYIQIHVHSRVTVPNEDNEGIKLTCQSLTRISIKGVLQPG